MGSHPLCGALSERWLLLLLVIVSQHTTDVCQVADSYQLFHGGSRLQGLGVAGSRSRLLDVWCIVSTFIKVTVTADF